MYICVRDIDFVTALLDFGVVPTVWYFLFSFNRIKFRLKCTLVKNLSYRYKIRLFTSLRK